ncbi:IS21-like element helper ATPase IstB [Ghiorsea bivora]|uniref:IS21-like element helper ATPase IstB n=1 Tax=Ghiorsea bivora TaxID=1485545 RepID=UPI000570C765|nr:IS21-like element helper ATPase IstB [Ghiorsea bivora]
MSVQQVKQKMVQLGLHGMEQSFENQMRLPNFRELSFEDRIAIMLDNEETWRENKRLERLLRSAKLREQACMEDIDYNPKRGLDKSALASLSTCDWIDRGQNMIITGATGAGKTWLACALGNQACRKGLKTKFYRIPLLLEELADSHKDLTFARKLNQIAKLDLLILDDFGLTKFDASARRELLEVAECRSGLKSTIITTQLPVEKWHDCLSSGNPTAADAIIDRLTGSSHRIVLKGDSMRTRKV